MCSITKLSTGTNEKPFRRIISPRLTRDGSYLIVLDHRNIRLLNLTAPTSTWTSLSTTSTSTATSTTSSRGPDRKAPTRPDSAIMGPPIIDPILPQRCRGEVIGIAIHPITGAAVVACRDGYLLQWTSPYLGSEYKVDEWSEPLCRFLTGPGEQNLQFRYLFTPSFCFSSNQTALFGFHHRPNGSIVAMAGEGWWELWHATPPSLAAGPGTLMTPEPDEDIPPPATASVSSTTATGTVQQWTVTRQILTPIGYTPARGLPGRPEWNGLAIADQLSCWAADSRWGIVYKINITTGMHECTS
jgi:hypothetical protein